MLNRIVLWAAVMTVLLSLTVPVVAQQAPNAGSILRQLEPTPPPLPVPQVDGAPKRDRPAVPPGPPIHVRAFHIEGNRLIGTRRLQRLLSGYVGRDLTPADLREATDAIARAYHRAGWLARVFVPPQRVENGVLRVQVVEGHFGRADFADGTDVNTLHVTPQRILARVQSRLTPGQPLSLADLTRGVLLAGDLPGVAVAADEVGGEDPGLTNVVVRVENQALVSGQFALDNYGQASIGSERATGWLDFNSLFGFGEEFGVLGILTPDLQFGRLNALLPLTDDGLSLGLNAAGLNYAVVTPQYKASQPRGSSQSFGGDLDYQLIRASDHNVAIGLTVARKNFRTANIAGAIGDYHVYDALLFANGNVYDDFGGGAVSTAAVSAGRGWVSMGGSPGELADRFGPDTQGQFNLLRYRIDRTQKIWGPLAGYLSVSGQLSYQNLDPSEEFYLGGPGGVRAYAVSSNGGSTGQLLNAELRWAAWRSPRCTCGLKLLYDVGHIRQYANVGFPLAPVPNGYFLQGAGLGAYGAGPGGLSFAITAVHRVGGDAAAEDLDSGLTGARQATRVWASLTWQF